MHKWIVLWLLFSSFLAAQQVADTAWIPEIIQPAYPSGKGPVVKIDEAHNNFHKAGERYWVFAEMLRRDGYQVAPFQENFSASSLEGTDILVISNALNAVNLGNWSLPNPSAFSRDEITAIRNWVDGGGALFLIADHMPFPGAAADLAMAFGVQFSNGFAMDTTKRRPPDIFRRDNGLLKEHPITQGRSAGERITSVATFTGQAFLGGSKLQPILELSDNFLNLMPETAWRFEEATTKIAPAAGWTQLGVMQFGKGRIVFSGEAAMFTAQLAGPQKFTMGMNHPDAGENARFLLNIMHWLSGLLQ